MLFNMLGAPISGHACLWASCDMLSLKRHPLSSFVSFLGSVQKGKRHLKEDKSEFATYFGQ